MKKILVIGFYNKSNIGDELFKEAYRHLFPTLDFTFVDTINLDQLEGMDAVFFGGGSFLLDEPFISPEALEQIKQMPIFYLGIGVETGIHPTHLALLSLAKLIATRSADQVERLKLINSQVMLIPDLVYSLQSQVQHSDKINRSVLVMPNIAVLPHRLSPYWKHAAWAHFKSEFAQFLDVLVDDGYKIKFLSMCRSPKENDDWAASEIIAHMSHRDRLLLAEQPQGIEQITQVISQYQMVITQRFHGIVLSAMTQVPCLALYHHDKLKPTGTSHGSFLSYYNCSKQSFFDAFHSINHNSDDVLSIKTDTFEELNKEVISLLI